MEDIDSGGKQVTVYSEMNEADQKFTYELAVNAMKVQDKGMDIYILNLIESPLHLFFSFINVRIKSLVLPPIGDLVVYQKDLAQSIKLELDKQKGGIWNVIVGKSFGSFVTHETKTISYFCIGPLSFLVWRHG